MAGNMPLAASMIDKAVQLLRTAGQVDYLPKALLARADLARRNGDLQRAEKDIDEAREMAERSGMLLHLTDAAIERVQLLLARIPEVGSGDDSTRMCWQERSMAEMGSNAVSLGGDSRANATSETSLGQPRPFARSMHDRRAAVLDSTTAVEACDGERRVTLSQADAEWRIAAEHVAKTGYGRRTRKLHALREAIDRLGGANNMGVPPAPPEGSRSLT
jgi:ATP/maltotriose-dependent transcriptional regulator MalT